MKKYYAGDKFVIKIGDVLDSYTEIDPLYRIKGFNSLVFDEAGLDKLEKYKTHEDAYEEGKKFAGDTYKQLFDLNSAELEDIFGKDGGSFKHILSKYSIDLISEMLQSYVPTYEVGDELSCNGERWLVTFVQREDELNVFYLLREDGYSDAFIQSDMKNFRKTGRKFNSIDNFRANKVDKQ